MHAVFSDYAPTEMVMRAMLGGACNFLTKPVQDKDICNIWEHVFRWQLNLDSGAAADAQTSDSVVIRQDDTPRKRGSGELNGSDEEGSEGNQQQKQGRTTKRTKFNSSPEQHLLLVKAAKELKGTKGNASSRCLLN
jgi:two-component response regulator (ARR-B family)